MHEGIKGPVKLFKSDFLNNNPILLEYLARVSVMAHFYKRKRAKKSIEQISRTSNIYKNLQHLRNTFKTQIRENNMVNGELEVCIFPFWNFGPSKLEDESRVIFDVLHNI